ncbi:glycosyltransferase family 2 protein [Vibrio alfacsensis]|uniref:glycosyltransferase family 2 protein n=1 Tax=Vibrio alfacsensis TaxID=1074311 RepID=UPI0040695D09
MMNNYQTRAPNTYSEILCNRNLQLIQSGSHEFEQAELVIAIAHKNQIRCLRRCLESAINQTLVKRHIARIVLLDDSSDIEFPSDIKTLFQHPSITLLKAECGSPARSRNLLLDWADGQSNLQWIARLDADDELCSEASLEALWDVVKGTNKVAAIGSNKLRLHGEILSKNNIANPRELSDHFQLAGLIEKFASGNQSRELPSCNLLLKKGLGLRYPNIRSAEDHWLVTKLLMLYSTEVAVCPYHLFTIYSLDGEDTQNNRNTNSWQDQRNRLAYVARTWSTLLAAKRQLLGVGMEGAVWLQHNQVVKEFYPWAITDNEVIELKSLLADKELPIPKVTWRKCDGLWQYQTDYVGTTAPGKTIKKQAIIRYLSSLYKAGVTTLNIKRDNLIITPNGHLQYIDIGKDIKPLTTAYYLDMCARLYAIGILGYSDEEVVRRNSWRRQDEALKALPGFEAFYGELLMQLHPNCSETVVSVPTPLFKSDSVTLLIKACGQDAAVLTEQVTHIITQLSYPVTFSETILLIDPHQGEFLRQYASSNLPSVTQQAKNLEKNGLIDRILIAPRDPKIIESTYKKWFDQTNCTQTHTIKKAPLFPQIWGFDQVNTRYVLQCDLDVLIGRRDWQHDYIADMLYACEPNDVLTVGFNIPKNGHHFIPYHGDPGEFPPEVRFGLLDLTRIRNQLPVDNPLSDNKLKLTWHRALQASMRQRGLRAVRGGDPRSYYIHPRNEHKDLTEFSMVRDIIAQGNTPTEQCEAFDWVPGMHWKYPQRNESIVFLLKGRLTDYDLLNRCLDSLRHQTNQNFGLILIDDASCADHNWCYPMLLGDLKTRTTLIRHTTRQGRMPNFLLAIKEICQDPHTFIAVLDQDDCLMQDDVVSRLHDAKRQGADFVQMPMYRPNKPLNLYVPDYTNPREAAGANVWSHLRVFTKELFEQVPERYFKHNDSSEWFETVTDYLTMLPMAELAKSPIYVDSGYSYWHLRKNISQDDRTNEKQLIRELLSKPSLALQAQKIAEQMQEPFEDDQRR